MKPITLIANWKMNLSLGESVRLVEDIERRLPHLPEWFRIILAPSFAALPSVHPQLRQCALAAQDMFWERKGAYTGEISSAMLEEVGCTAVILGHSERRQHLHETDVMVQRKVRAALAARLTPIVCVGETAEERAEGKHEFIVMEQVASVCAGLHLGDGATLTIAYEPVWAIGTGKAVDPQIAEHMHQVILHTAREHVAVSHRISVIYGGSVDATNVKDVVSQQHISGCLIGGASQRAQSFLDIVDAVLS